MHVRIATPNDSRAVADLGERTFRDAFGAMNLPDDLELHIAKTYGEALQLAEVMSPLQVMLVGESDGRLIAYALLGWGAAPECITAGNPGEIQRFYVSHEWHGQGVAQELMKASLDSFRERNTDTVWLSAWQQNPRGIAFYEKCGFRIVGEQQFVVGNDPQQDYIMAMNL